MIIFQVAVLCLLGIALAAEDSTSRKSRQVITPLATPTVPVVHPHPFDYLPQHHIVGPSVHYIQPAVPAIGLAHHAQIIPAVNVVHAAPQIPVDPTAVALQQPAIQRALGYVQASLQSVSGSSSNGQSENSQQTYYTPSAQSQNGQNNNQGPSSSSQQTPYGQLSSNQDYSSQANTNTASQSNQNTASFRTPVYSTPRPILANDNSQNSQGYYSQTGQQSQQDPSSGSYGFAQPVQGSSNNQQSSSGSNSYFSQSPQQFSAPRAGPQYNNLFQSQSNVDRSRQQSSSLYSSQLSGSNPSPRFGAQNTVAYYTGSQYNGAAAANQQQQQTGSNVDQSAAILSQNGQISYDGSYSYGFQSDNGIQSSQVGVMRNVGQYLTPVVHGSYSYTAPDGTPISARYYADETGFHVQGAHIPTPADGQASGQQQQQQTNQLVAVETN